MKKLFLVLIVFSLTGCWNYRELNNLAIATGIAIDKVDDNFQITIMIANSKKQSSSETNSQASTAVYTGKGETIYEAWKDAAMAISKQIYIGHIEVLILSEEVSKSDFFDSIDFLFRYPQTRNNFYIVIANSCNAGDVLKINLPLEFYPSQNIMKNLEITSGLQAFTDKITFNNLMKNLLEEGIDAILPSISIIGSVEEGNSEDNLKKSETDAYLKLGTLAIFKNDKFITFATKDESEGINILKNKVQTAEIKVTLKDENIVIEVNGSKAKINYNLNSNIPSINIDIDIAGAIVEVASDIDIDDPDIIKRIKEKSEEEVVRIVNSAIDLMKKKSVDPIGFGNEIYKKNYKYWYTIKNNWEDKILPKTNFNVNTSFEIETKGTTSTTIKED